MPVTLKDMANAIRFLSIDAIVRANDGHPGTPLGGADIATGLFARQLKFDPRHPDWPDRDRFVHSAGHGSMLIYSLLHLCGYRHFGIEQIKDFRVLGSNTAGHPEYEIAHGIETTTGPLGQGIANAVGMAIAERHLNARFGDGIVDHHTYAYVGDGCLMEGLSYEVIALAGHLRLGKLVFLWDDNRMTDDGATDQAVSEDNVARFELAGWHTQRVDGHDTEAVATAIAAAKADPRPSMIACRTYIGFGVPRIQNERAAHGGRLFAEDAAAARENLDWPHAEFVIPQPIYDAWAVAGHEGAQKRDAWLARYQAMPAADKAEFDRVMSGALPQGWADDLHAYKAESVAEQAAKPGIAASGEILSILASRLPELISGAPDLEAATKHKRQLNPFTRDDRAGRYIHYGVREHAMGSIMNGMSVHGGVKPVGTTFLVFSDYMRPALRMAALMKIPAMFVFSHDSIGIGKNGPTHQPVETLASLRAYPNIWVFRPADAVEMAECWELGVAHDDGPTTLICSRQPLTPVRTEPVAENLCARGAYILADAACGSRAATIFATGSEVAIALDAREKLEAEGIATAVISMPSWEVFALQDDAYRETIIGRGTARVAVEAAMRLGWDQFIGESGRFVGMRSFGASGDYPDLYRHFGITPDAVAAAVRAQLPASRADRIRTAAV